MSLTQEALADRLASTATRTVFSARLPGSGADTISPGSP